MKFTRLSIFLLFALVSASAGATSDQDGNPKNASAPADTAATLTDDMLGTARLHVAVYEDTLLDLARSNGLGFIEIIAANQGIDPWVPGTGTNIVLPTAHLLPEGAREGLVINLGEHRLYYFEKPGGAPRTFPIGVGREGWATPLGLTEVVRKKARPTWYPPKSIRAENPDLPRAIGPGPHNPLGTHALYFNWPGYLVHGTNQPWGVGRRVSHGCIRLYPEDIERLFSALPVGTPVAVLNRPVKVGWLNGELYVEAHPDPEQADQLESEGQITNSARSPADILFRIRERAGADAARLDWSAIRITLAERRGVPVQVTRSAGQ